VVGEIFDFNKIFQKEVVVINKRRRCKTPYRGEIALKQIATDSTGQPVLGPNEDANVVGLALSGGGIRSAAFCLGVLQALNKAGVIDRIDYLSTVSGGRYIGCSLSACLEWTKGIFPFEPTVSQDGTPSLWPAPDSEDTELGVLMEPEVSHGETEVYAGVQA
jgi:hypothetical protein